MSKKTTKKTTTRNTTAAGATKAAKRTRKAKDETPRDTGERGAPRAKRDGRLSALDAAAAVLAEASAPMGAQAVVDAMLSRGLWATAGKTPAATLHAALIRDITAKSDESRFLKTGPGRFALRG